MVTLEEKVTEVFAQIVVALGVITTAGTKGVITVIGFETAVSEATDKQAALLVMITDTTSPFTGIV